MSKFAKALRQAEQDAALGKNGSAPVEQTSSPVLVPAESNLSVEITDDHLVSLISPAAFEAEQYRALRHVVEQIHKTANVKVVAVSSPAVGDGKTTTTINLAGALAQSPEAKVLLVDGDVRRPSIGTLLRHVEAKPGLVDAILNPARTLDQVLVDRPQFNLSFIHAGRNLSSSPYELLKSTRLGDLLEEARQRFDYVVVDTPPLAAVQDCRLIARWVDGFLVVVAAHRTPRRLVEEALAVIEPTKIFGLVFNGDSDGRHISYYGYAGNYLETRPSLGRSVSSPARGRKWVWRRRGERR
jgi:capsular exopolysaccharide synthesis family protein